MSIKEVEMKYWVESSFVFEDTKKEYPEHWIIAVDRGEKYGTESIASFFPGTSESNVEIGKTDLDDLLEVINADVKEVCHD